MSKFISIDPSTTITGWAVFQDEQPIAWGKIDTQKVAYAFRFQFVINELVHIWHQHNFQEVIIEDVKFAWNSTKRNRNISGLQVMFKAIKEWAKSLNVPFVAYNPSTWKNAIVGHWTASKETTKENVRLRFPNVPDNLTEHEYDAIGIGAYRGALLKFEAMAKGG